MARTALIAVASSCLWAPRLAFAQQAGGDDPPAWAIVLIIMGFFIVFPAFWCAIVYGLSRLSGWQALRERYPARSDAPPNAFYTSAKIGWVNYNGVLKVGC